MAPPKSAKPEQRQTLRLLSRALAEIQTVEATPVREAIRQAISQAQAQAGDLDAAHRTALRIPASPRNTFRRLALTAVALARAQAGDPAGARRILAPYRSRANRETSEQRVARALAAGGDLTAAFETLARLPKWDRPLEELPLFARGAPRHVPTALAQARRMPTPGSRAWAQTVVALIQTRSGNPEAARRTLEQARKDAEDATETDSLVPRFPARIGVAVALARAGDFPAALDTMHRATPSPPAPIPIRHTLGLLEIARAQCEAGDRPGARRTLLPLYEPLFQAMAAPRAQNEDGREAAMAKRAVSLLLALHVRSGDLEGARREARRWPAETTLLPIALGQAEAGDFDGALQTRAQMPEADGYDIEPVPFLIGIAQAQLRAGRRAEAQRTLKEAARGVRTSPSGVSYEEESFPAVIAVLAENLVEAGDPVGARRLGLPVVEGWQRTTVWLMVARAQARRGGERDALAWADTLPTALQRSSALLGVAEGLLARLQPHGIYRRTPVTFRGYFDWLEAEADLLPSDVDPG